MDNFIYVIIGAVVIVAVVLIIRAKSFINKAQNEYDEVFMADVKFCITSVPGRTEGGTIEVDGVVKNTPITVGDVFRVIDKDGNVITTNVRVEAIDSGFLKKQMVDIIHPQEFVTLYLRTNCEALREDLFLKK